MKIFGLRLLFLIPIRALCTYCTGPSESQQRADFITNKIDTSDSIAASQFLKIMDTLPEWERPSYEVLMGWDTICEDSVALPPEDQP